MNTSELRSLLADRAADVEAPGVDRVAEVHGRIRTARRNRRLAVAGGLALVLAVGFGIGTARDATKADGPANIPDPTPSIATYDVVPSGSGPVALVPGAWALTAVGSSSDPLAVMDVPSGFLGYGQFMFDKGSADTAISVDPAAVDGPQFRAIGYWSPIGVYKNPCSRPYDPGTHPGGLRHVDTAAAMAEALGRQRLSSTSDPVPVTIDGHDGLYVELTAPENLDMPGCRQRGTLDVFETDSGTRWMNTPGMVDRYWIVETEGGLAVLNTSVGPGVSPARVKQLTDIVETARFVGE